MTASETSVIEVKRERVRQAMAAATEFRKQKRFHKAIELLREALEYQVETDQVYYRLGNIYYDSGDLEQAEAAYKQAIEINGNHANAHHNLSVVYKRKGKIAQFIKMIRKSVKLSMEKPGR